MTMTAITPNVRRLLELARWLTGEERKRRLGKPSEWDQGVWVRVDDDNTGSTIQAVREGDDIVVHGWTCGTAACAAGHISLEDGGMPAFSWDGELHPAPPSPGDIDNWRSYYVDVLDAVEDTVNSDYMWFASGPEMVDTHAQRVLGLDADQAAKLFHGDNTWDDMMTHIANLTGHHRDALILAVGGHDLPPDPDDEDDVDCGPDCCPYCG